MVKDLLCFIGDEIRTRNEYFDKHTSIACQTEDGRIYAFTVDEEKEYCGLSDADGIGFYIKINPIITFIQGRQLTSIKQQNEGTIECNLIAYQVNSEINILNWQDKLTESLKSINFNGYSGNERHIKIELKKINTNPQQIFKEETKKEADGFPKIIQVTYNVKFSSTKYDCEECNIYN